MRYSENFYNGFETSVENANGQVQTTISNAAGWLVENIDYDEHSILYSYYANGLFHEVKSPDGHTISVDYDIFGNKTHVSDPDMGEVDYEYNAFGELINEIKNGVMVLDHIEYDPLGRIIQKEEPGGITTYKYDHAENGIGKISEISYDRRGGNENIVNFKEFFTYDYLGRIVEHDEWIDKDLYSTKYTYDEYSRQQSMEYPSGYTLGYEYNSLGYMHKMTDSRGKTIWRAMETNVRKQLTSVQLGDKLISEYGFDDITGMLKRIQTNSTNKDVIESLQHLSYEWDMMGNLEQRSDLNKWLEESFSYDNLNRLTGVYRNELQVDEIIYDALGSGNISEKMGVGEYQYENTGGAGPHAVTKITGDLNGIREMDQLIDYTFFDKVCSITEGMLSLNIVYGIGHQRKIQVLDNGLDIQTKTYIGGGYEKIDLESGEDKEIHYITALNGVIGAYTMYGNGKDEFNYILKDHLGSMNCITDEEGNLIEELSFDAWGKRRNPYTWNDENIPGTIKFDRGFTMHEHLDNFKLINMNGRMYDPVIARFLSADPIGLETSTSASLNRYGYVNNNPLNATDPSGYYRRGNGSSWGVSGGGDGAGDFISWDYFDRSWYWGSYMADQDARFEAEGAINSGNVKMDNWSWYSNILYEQYGHNINMPGNLGSFFNPVGEPDQKEKVSDEQVNEFLAYIDNLLPSGGGCSVKFDGGDPPKSLGDDESSPAKKPKVIFGLSFDVTFAIASVGYTVELMILIHPETNEPVQFISHGYATGFEATGGVNLIIILPKNNFKFSDIEGTSWSFGASYIGGIYKSGNIQNPNTHGSTKSRTYDLWRIGVGPGGGGSYAPNNNTIEFNFFTKPPRLWWK